MNLPENHLLNGRYRIEKLIGQGGFGKTYKAHDEQDKLDICVKELFISGSSTRGQGNTVNSVPLAGITFESFKRKFLKEASELAKFNHPNIVRVVDVFEENNTAYFVMDFVEGETIKDRVKREGALPRKQAIDVMGQLLDAVQEVHKKGKLHRDIKPDNILLTPEGKVVLIDFGNARNFSDGKTLTQTALLTPGYAPWEQYAERAKRTKASDIYSLGATMYFLLTGKKPLPAPDRMAEDLLAPHEVNKRVDTQISSAVMLALQMKPKDRFQSVADFRSALQFLGDPPPHTSTPQPAPGPGGPSGERSGRSTTMLWVILILLLGAIATVFYIYTLTDSSLLAIHDEDSDAPNKEIAGNGQVDSAQVDLNYQKFHIPSNWPSYIRTEGGGFQVKSDDHDGYHQTTISRSQERESFWTFYPEGSSKMKLYTSLYIPGDPLFSTLDWELDFDVVSDAEVVYDEIGDTWQSCRVNCRGKEGLIYIREYYIDLFYGEEDDDGMWSHNVAFWFYSDRSKAVQSFEEGMAFDNDRFRLKPSFDFTKFQGFPQSQIEGGTRFESTSYLGYARRSGLWVEQNDLSEANSEWVFYPQNEPSMIKLESNCVIEGDPLFNQPRTIWIDVEWLSIEEGMDEEGKNFQSCKGTANSIDCWVICRDGMVELHYNKINGRYSNVIQFG